MAEIVDLAMMRRASTGDATAPHDRTEAIHVQGTKLPLHSIDIADWRALAGRAIEPNGYYLPDWELAVNATAPGRTDASAISAWSGDRLVALMPVVPLWRAAKIPQIGRAHV